MITCVDNCIYQDDGLCGLNYTASVGGNSSDKTCSYRIKRSNEKKTVKNSKSVSK